MISVFWTLVILSALLVWLGVLYEFRHGRADAGSREPVANARAARWIIGLVWSFGAVPPLIGLFTSGRQKIAFGSPAVTTALQGRVGTAIAMVIALLCIHLIIRNLHRSPATRIWSLAAFLLPWFAVEVVSAAAAGYVSGRQFLLFPLIGIAFWLAAPPIRVVSTIGVLAAATAAFSLIFALVSPLALVDSGPAGIEKALIGNGRLLAGPYNSSNGLALALALGLPAVTFISSRRLRLASFAVIAVALVWAAGRTSILAGAAVVAVYFLSRDRRLIARSLTALVLSVGLTLVVWTPMHEADPFAFTRRGMVWIAGREVWHQHFWFGAGPEFYERPNHLGFFALYGHNLMVDSAVRGGVVALVAIGVWLAVLTRRAFELAPTNVFALLFIVAFVWTSWLEVPLPLNNLGYLGYASWLPAAVVYFARDKRPQESAVRITNADVTHGRLMREAHVS